jgi:threonylcarbamoyladenosine tRNA methylthiotransferase MtaB
MEGVDVIVHNDEKEQIDRILPVRLPDLFTDEPDKSCSPYIEDFHDRNRAWLKISDGCNQWCSFCIITIVRGRLANRPAGEIIDEINHLVSQGYREIVLTGINMGYYHDKQREPKVRNLAALCRLIMEETDLPRMRLSSIEPQAVRDDMVETYADSNGRICRHFHLPLQSAATEILRKMRRPYNQAIYIKRVSNIKEAVPGTTIGADVIVGFPGETDDHFDRTKRLCESGLVDYLHVFSYSDRPGTSAAELPGKVNPEVIRNRNKTLTDVSYRIHQANLHRQVGQTLGVIAEHKSEGDGSHFAVSDNYLKVKLPAADYRGREIVPVRVTGVCEDHLTGVTRVD